MRNATLGLVLLALAAGCGRKAPQTKPAAHADALTATNALDCLGQKFPKDVATGRWIRFPARFERREGDAWRFKGFLDDYDVCIVKTAADLSALKQDQRVVIVARYDGFTMPKDAGGGDDAFLARRQFSEAWIWLEQ